MQTGRTTTDGVVALAIETSGAVGGVALGRDDTILEERAFSTARRHAVDLLPTIDALCRTHGVSPRQIARVYVSRGPGSFTGLRIGVTVARMIALSHGAEVVGVATLEVIAQNALDLPDPPPHVAALLDAKRDHVYAGLFEFRESRYMPVGAAAEVEPVSFLRSQAHAYALLGEGVPIYRNRLQAIGGVILPDTYFAACASNVFRLGRRLAASGPMIEPRLLVPDYIRPPEPQEKLAARTRLAP